MKKNLRYFMGDSMIASDEWDHFQYLIGEDLKALDIEGPWNMGFLPGIADFENDVKQRLIEVGFKRKALDNPEELERLFELLDEQGREFRDPVWLNNPPYGLPDESYTVRPDNRIMWVKPNIEAGIRTLKALSLLKGLLINKDALRVYLRTVEMVINFIRAGNIADFAKAREEGDIKSLKTRETKKIVMRCIIDNIFKKNPHRPRTLGEVWNKIARGQGIRLISTKMGYVAKIGKDSQGGDIVIVISDDHKKFTYAKRSLQTFIDEVKENPNQIVTQ